MNDNKDAFKEMFAKMAEGNGSEPQAAADSSQTQNGKDAQTDAQPSNESKSEPIVQTPTNPTPDVKIGPNPETQSNPPVQPSSAEIEESKELAPTEKCDENNPIIQDENEAKNQSQGKIASNDDDEEEQIVTTKNPESSPPIQAPKDLPQADQPMDLEAEYASDEFKAPWENLEVALTIFDNHMGLSENPQEFEQINWNLKADIIERKADLEIARENTEKGICLYKELIELCVKHNCDRASSRTIACILYKIGCAH